MKITRRGFIRNVSVAGGGLTLGFPQGATAAAPTGELQPSAFLRVTPTDEIIVTLHKAEMGQGVVTGLVTLFAEELEVAPQRIRYEFAGVDKAFRDPQYHMQITGGSNSMRESYTMLREAGACARLMLLQAAAERSGRPVESLRARDGAIEDSEGEVLFLYGDLSASAARLPVPVAPPLKQAADLRLIGTFDTRLDSRPKVDGSANYAMDSAPPDVLVAVVVRPPVAQGRLAGFDAAEAGEMPGVHAVVAIDSGVAVVASNYWRARKAAEAVTISWQASESPLLDSAAIDAALARPFAEDDFRNVREEGTPPPGNTGRLLEAEYNAPFLAHAPMEPLNCTVAPGEYGAEVWVGSQAPDLAQKFAARALGVEASAVTVHNQFLGGGFGRRLTPDDVYEAAQIAAAVGRPVKLVWSREDDIRHDFYRPPSKSRLRANISENGRVRSWEHRVAVPSVMQSSVEAMGPGMLPAWVPDFLVEVAGNLIGYLGPLSTEGAKQLPYSFDHVLVAYHNVPTPVRLGTWRSVGHSFNAFAVESFVDELAHATGEDPVEFRRRNLPADSRERLVLDAVAQMSGWGRSPAGHFQGVAVHAAFESVVAEVVEISLPDGRLKLEKAFCAVHCGTAVNPDIVRAQMEGGMIFGLSAALKSEITLLDGAVQQSNFHDYPVLRMNEAPEVEVLILDSDDPPTGVGEPGTPPAAPALANAIFAATGKRLRDLPLRLS